MLTMIWAWQHCVTRWLKCFNLADPNNTEASVSVWSRSEITTQVQLWATLTLSFVEREASVFTQLIQQGGDGAQDSLHGALGLSGIVLCLLSVVRRLRGSEQILRVTFGVVRNVPVQSRAEAALTIPAIIMSRSASAFFTASSCSAALSWSIMSLTSLSSLLVSWKAFSASSLVLAEPWEDLKFVLGQVHTVFLQLRFFCSEIKQTPSIFLLCVHVYEISYVLDYMCVCLCNDIHIIFSYFTNFMLIQQ